MFWQRTCTVLGVSKVSWYSKVFSVHKRNTDKIRWWFTQGNIYHNTECGQYGTLLQILMFAYREFFLKPTFYGRLYRALTKWLTSSQASWSGPAASPQSCISKKKFEYLRTIIRQNHVCCLFHLPNKSQRVARLRPSHLQPVGVGVELLDQVEGVAELVETREIPSEKKTQRCFCFQYVCKTNVILFSNCIRM